MKQTHKQALEIPPKGYLGDPQSPAVEEGRRDSICWAEFSGGRESSRHEAGADTAEPGTGAH